MKTKIIIVSFTSYTENDNYLHTEQKVFTNSLNAQDYYEDQCNKARCECQWAEYWDADQDERKEATEYAISERKEQDSYRVESEAYCGYHVTIKKEEQEIEVPYATDRTKYGMTLKEIRDEIAEFTGSSLTDATRRAQTFIKNCCVPLTWVVSIRLSFGKYSKAENNEVVYYGENRDTLNFDYTDREGDRHHFAIID